MYSNCWNIYWTVKIKLADLMQIFHKRTDNSKNERCQGFQNFTFQFIYAQRSKKCMMVCNSKLYKNSMHHYMQQYAIIQKDCIYLTWIHFWNWNCFCKNILGLPSSGPCIEKRIKKFFFKSGNNYENVSLTLIQTNV